MKQEIKSDKAPQPIGPYSQGIKVGNMFFTAGQVALHPETGAMIQDDIEMETDRVMQNLKALLEASGMNFHQVVKCSIFLSDMNDFAKVNEIYSSYFTSPYPVRETVQVARLPKDARVEISLIAAE